MRSVLLTPVSLGILLMLGAYLLFSLADSTTKWVTLLGFPALQLAFIRYGFHLLVTSAETAYRGIEREEISDNFWLLILRAAALSSATVANFYALKYLSLSMYSAIMFSAPIFISFSAWWLLGEHVGPWRWFAILVGFVGILIVVRPFADGFNVGALFSLYAAIGLGLYSIITRKLANNVRPHVMQFFTGLFGTVVLLPFAIWLWKPMPLDSFMLMLMVGFFSWLGHEMLTRAHKLAEVSVLMPYSYSFILYMTLTGFLLYGEVPDRFTLIGAAIIVLSGLIIWYREKNVTTAND